MCQCPPGKQVCDGACINVQNDPANCGGCGIWCNWDQVCANAQCTCQNGMTECFGTCTYLTADPANCGACGNVCPGYPNWNAMVCASDGKGGAICTCPSPTTQTWCDATQVCSDLKTDTLNCGSCGNTCTIANEICAGGSCTCQAGQVLCPNACTWIEFDPYNCGGCGNICPATEVCTPDGKGGGMCACPVDSPTQCTRPNGQTFCANTNYDRNNCGKCGKVCGASQTCLAGKCQ
jgi:hypothetical protein